MLGGRRLCKEKPALQILQKQAEDPDQETAKEAYCLQIRAGLGVRWGVTVRNESFACYQGIVLP